MDFHKQYRSMNENITPSDALVQQTIAKMESGRPHRARKPLKIILAVAAALACVSTAVAANQEAVLRVLYQIAPGMAEYPQPVGRSARTGASSWRSFRRTWKAATARCICR
mgnify:CR=1 FL=1